MNILRTVWATLKTPTLTPMTGGAQQEFVPSFLGRFTASSSGLSSLYEKEVAEIKQLRSEGETVGAIAQKIVLLAAKNLMVPSESTSSPNAVKAFRERVVELTALVYRGKVITDSQHLDIALRAHVYSAETIFKTLHNTPIVANRSDGGIRTGDYHRGIVQYINEKLPEENKIQIKDLRYDINGAKDAINKLKLHPMLLEALKQADGAYVKVTAPKTTEEPHVLIKAGEPSQNGFTAESEKPAKQSNSAQFDSLEDDFYQSLNSIIAKENDPKALDEQIKRTLQPTPLASPRGSGGTPTSEDSSLLSARST